MRFIFIFIFLLIPTLAKAQVSAIALHGQPKYQAGFSHFDYVNPDAPKGGSYSEQAFGSFDSLNPYIIKGVPVTGLNLIYQSLMTKSADEAFSMYANIAETVTIAEDHLSATFTLNPNARWHDGEAIDAQDVVWTFNILMEHGSPAYKGYYADIDEAIAIDNKTVKFTFKTADNKELPLILGGLTILPEHYWTAEGNDFSKTTLKPPLGSGPYKIATIDAGRSITYERVKDWWAADLPVNRGRFNFDEVKFMYYRDMTVALEGLFANEFDLRREYTAKTWATSYNNELINSGQIVKDEVKHQSPVGMQGFIMNTRRPIFADRELRRAIQHAFDFEWSNRQFAFNAYKRTDSYFENSELASSGLPQGRELEILEAYRDQLPEEVFTTPFENPITQGNGNNRTELAKAIQILDEAGYKTGEGGIRIHPETGEALRFEIMHRQPEFERWVLPFIRNLKRIGIEAEFRVVDTTQFVERLNNFDFDMTIGGAAQSLTPGNEQMDYWHSSKADQPGSRNYMGVRSPVIDDLVMMVINAPDREELIHRVRALDRVLLWDYYVIPQWHIDTWRIAHWDKFGKPDTQAPYSLGAIDTWWVKE